MIRGFLFGLGFFSSFFVIIIALAKIAKYLKKKQHATVADWKKYNDEVLKLEDFAEAAFVINLISNKKDDDEIITPEGYKIKANNDLIFDETEESISKLKIKKTFKIIKIKGNGE